MNHRIVQKCLEHSCGVTGKASSWTEHNALRQEEAHQKVSAYNSLCHKIQYVSTADTVHCLVPYVNDVICLMEVCLMDIGALMSVNMLVLNREKTYSVMLSYVKRATPMQFFRGQNYKRKTRKNIDIYRPPTFISFNRNWPVESP